MGGGRGSKPIRNFSLLILFIFLMDLKAYFLCQENEFWPTIETFLLTFPYVSLCVLGGLLDTESFSSLVYDLESIDLIYLSVMKHSKKSALQSDYRYRETFSKFPREGLYKIKLLELPGHNQSSFCLSPLLRRQVLQQNMPRWSSHKLPSFRVSPYGSPSLQQDWILDTGL